MCIATSCGIPVAQVGNPAEVMRFAHQLNSEMVLEKLLESGLILWLGLWSGSLVYGFFRYGHIPANPIPALFSSAFLQRVLSKHTSGVNALAISLDGQILASSSSDLTIKIWNLHTGEELHTLEGHSQAVNCVAINPDGRTFISGSDDETIKIWNLNTGEELHTLEGHADAVLCLAISPEGETLASGSADKTVKVWNLETREWLHTIAGYESEVLSVAISPDGQTLASGSGFLDGAIKLWNLKTGSLLQTLSGHYVSFFYGLGRQQASADSVTFSPEGTMLVSGGSDRTIRIWNLSTGKLIRTLHGHSDFVNVVSISPDGQTLVSGGTNSDETIMIWRPMSR